jgi:putative Mg2+ transporter-C (MgtC) family protein
MNGVGAGTNTFSEVHMSVELEWLDIALRLALTVAAGFLFGINRTEHGKEAGLRTTLLVCLAASVAMILTNFLMSTRGKAPDSFVNIDPMRLPLGILTGMGFIGGGAILRRGDLVLGVTTAATLWMVTVIGLCFGAGQIGLGLVSSALGGMALWVVKAFELRLQQDRRATLILVTAPEGPTDAQIRVSLLEAGLSITTWSVAFNNRRQPQRRRVRCVVRWHGPVQNTQPPALVNQLAQEPGVVSLRWILAAVA